MPVTVDHSPLRAEELGLRTVGQVLTHLKREKRLVVHVLIDGLEPDLGRLTDVRKSPLKDHQVFIETADPNEMALDVLNQVEAQLGEADRIKSEAAKLLQTNQNVRAMEKLSGCLTTWQHAQESLLGTARLLNISLEHITVGDKPLTDLVVEFAEQLKQIKSSLENRDFVTLGDLLIYETTQTSGQWRQALCTLRKMIAAKTPVA
ncbi:MAG TPA: hypothetical protein VHX86_08530 [Tepidisphaeraceae bacterium]|jgi:hypothetical protein|nr:hypothetical protein [Tepidisphaeraceae bacterium]